MQSPSPSPPIGGAMPARSYAPVARYGGFWIRVVAYIIDTVIVTTANAIVDAMFQVNPANWNSFRHIIAHAQADPQSATYGVALTLEILITIAYFAGMWSYMGGTIGQRIFKLRVVDATTGQPISLGKSLLRWVAVFISFIVLFIGVIWVAFDSRKQGWADKIAGTLVLQG